MKALTDEGFWAKNGKKFALQAIGLVGLIILTALDKVDASVSVPIIAAVIGINAGAVTR